MVGHESQSQGVVLPLQVPARGQGAVAFPYRHHEFSIAQGQPEADDASFTLLTIDARKEEAEMQDAVRQHVVRKRLYFMGIVYCIGVLELDQG